MLTSRRHLGGDPRRPRHAAGRDRAGPGGQDDAHGQRPGGRGDLGGAVEQGGPLGEGGGHPAGAGGGEAAAPGGDLEDHRVVAVLHGDAGGHGAGAGRDVGDELGEQAGGEQPDLGTVGGGDAADH